MSKELIEQLAKDAGFPEYKYNYSVLLPKLEAFAKAYQAAAPIDNVAEALEKAAKLCDRYINHEAWEGRDPKPIVLIQEEIRALIPDTQADAHPTQGQSND
jgi:hypothetical protein